jgi:hypothetical protein
MSGVLDRSWCGSVATTLAVPTLLMAKDFKFLIIVLFPISLLHEMFPAARYGAQAQNTPLQTTTCVVAQVSSDHGPLNATSET